MASVNPHAGEEPQPHASTATPADAPEPEPELDPTPDQEAEAWREPPAVQPEPDPTVVTSPVVVPAVTSHRLVGSHPLIVDSARAWRTSAAHARLAAVVRQRRSTEGNDRAWNLLRPRERGADRGPRQPWIVLPALVLLGLLAAFFAWVSAEPFWLAVGHGETGTVTVVKDRASVAQRCLGNFAAEGGRFQARAVPVTGVDESRCAVGAAMPARMVSATGREAYGGENSGLTARWAVGFLLVAACSVMIVRISGAARFVGRQRVAAVALTFAAPLAIMIGILAATF